MRALWAELRKLLSLPATWLGSALTVLLPVGAAALMGSQLATALRAGETAGLLSTSSTDEGFGQLTLGLVGVCVLAVTIVSSEYAKNAGDVGGARQVTTTMIAVPARGKLMAAKLAVLVAWVVGLAVATMPLTLWVSALTLGEYATDFGATLVPRSLGALLYWVTMALLAAAITTLTRTGTIPLVVLIANASLISVSLLLSQLTSWVKVLPDVAGLATFLTDLPIEGALSVPAAVAISLAWAVAAALTAVGSHVVRDA